MSLLLNKVRASLIKLAFTKKPETREKLLKIAVVQKFDIAQGLDEGEQDEVRKRRRSIEPIGKLQPNQEKLLKALGFDYTQDRMSWPEISSHVKDSIGLLEPMPIVQSLTKGDFEKKAKAVYNYYSSLYEELNRKRPIAVAEQKRLKEKLDAHEKLKPEERAPDYEVRLVEYRDDLEIANFTVSTHNDLFLYEKEQDDPKQQMFKAYKAVANFDDRLRNDTNSFLNWYKYCPNSVGWAQTWKDKNPTWPIQHVTSQLEDLQTFIGNLPKIEGLAQEQQIEEVTAQVTVAYKRLYPILEKEKSELLVKEKRMQFNMTNGPEGSKVAVTSIGANLMNALFVPPKSAGGSPSYKGISVLQNKKYPKLDNLSHLSSVSSLDNFLRPWGLTSKDFLSIHDVLREKVWKAMKKGEGAIASKQVLTTYESRSKSYYKDWMNEDLATINNELTQDIYVVASASFRDLQTDVIQQLGHVATGELQTGPDGRFEFVNPMGSGAEKAIKKIVTSINNSILKIVGEKDFSLQVQKELDAELEDMIERFVDKANDHFSNNPHPEHGYISFDANKPNVAQDMLRMGYNGKASYKDPHTQTVKTLTVEQYDDLTREIKLNKKSIEYPSSLKFNAIMDTIYNPNGDFVDSKRLTILRALLGSEDVPSMRWAAKAPDTSYTATYGFHIPSMKDMFERGLKAELQALQFIPVTVMHPQQKKPVEVPYYIDMTSAKFAGVFGPKLAEMVEDYAKEVQADAEENFKVIIEMLQDARKEMGRDIHGPLNSQDVEVLMTGRMTALKDITGTGELTPVSNVFSQSGIIYQTKNKGSHVHYNHLVFNLTKFYTEDLHKFFWAMAKPTSASFILSNDKKTVLEDLTPLRAKDNGPLSWIALLVKEAGLTASGSFKNNPEKLMEYIQYGVASELLVSAMVSNINAPYWQANKQKYDKAVPKTMNAALSRSKTIELDKAVGEDETSAHEITSLGGSDGDGPTMEEVEIQQELDELMALTDNSALVDLMEKEIAEQGFLEGDLSSLTSHVLKTKSLLQTLHTFDSSLVNYLKSHTGDSGAMSDALAMHIFSSALHTNKDDLRSFMTFMVKAYSVNKGSVPANLGLGLLYYFTDSLFSGGGTYFRNSTKGGGSSFEVKPTPQSIRSVEDVLDLMIAATQEHHKVTLKSKAGADKTVTVNRNPILYMPLDLDGNSYNFGDIASDDNGVPILSKAEFDVMDNHNIKVAQSVCTALQTAQVHIACPDLNLSSPQAFLDSWKATYGAKALDGTYIRSVGLSALKSGLKAFLSPLVSLATILTSIKPLLHKEHDAETLAYTLVHNLRAVAEVSLASIDAEYDKYLAEQKTLLEVQGTLNENLALLDLENLSEEELALSLMADPNTSRFVEQKEEKVKGGTRMVPKVKLPQTDYGYFLTKEEVKEIKTLQKAIPAYQKSLKESFASIKAKLDANRALGKAILQALDQIMMKSSAYKQYIFPKIDVSAAPKDNSATAVHTALQTVKESHPFLSSLSATEFAELLILLTSNAFKPLQKGQDKSLLVLEGQVQAFIKESTFEVHEISDLKFKAAKETSDFDAVEEKMAGHLEKLVKDLKKLKGRINKKFSSEEARLRLEASINAKEALVKLFTSTAIRTASPAVLEQRAIMFNSIKNILTTT